MITCITVDDEPLALDVIEDYIQTIPFLKLVKSFDNALQAVDFLQREKIDLIFLDIQMEELTGIQMLNILKPKPEVIFTTAYDKFALQGYELDVTDYLLKPISFERFVKAVDKVHEKLCRQANSKYTPEEVSIFNPKIDYFFIKSGFKLHKVSYDEILYIEGQGDYLKIVTPKARIMTLQTFKGIEEILPSNHFIRVHKSYIVTVDKIESIEGNMIKVADKLIPIGESYKKSFQMLLDKKRIV
ncbi:MAG: response regulator transcription factor [Bacteroidales bacterium]|nr:response regulator transcription factor [Bacteroidota bacterium]MBL6949699.1 response regulator transcription factor [Bacteroidales bacterium]